MAHIVITGGNRGIGLELARQYQARGDDVTVACRKSNADLAALGVRVIEGINVADNDCAENLRVAFGDETIDVLINNAGILLGDTFDTVDFDRMLEQYKVNTIGPLRVTKALVDNIKAGGKLAIVSSRVGSIEDNGSGNNYGYRASKTAVNQVGTNLKYDLLPRDIAVAILHPGLVATEMTGGTGIEPKDAAAGLIQRIDELTLETTGGFWHAEGYRLPW